MNSELKKLEKEKQAAVHLGKWKEAADACNYIGNELCRLGHYDDALAYHREELEYNEMVCDRLGIAVANRKLGECYAERGNFTKALSHIDVFKTIAIELENKVEEQRAWATLGRTFYMKFMDYPKKDKTLKAAEQSYKRALELSDSEDIKSSLSSKESAEMRARCLLNLGLVCEYQGNMTQCATYIRHAIFLASKYGLHEDLNRCQSSLAGLYQKHGESSLALRLLDGAISSAEKLRDKTLLCDELSTKAIILVSLKDFNGARHCLKKAFKIQSPIEVDHQRITKYLKICAGLSECEKKLQEIDLGDSHERKLILEKIADGLSSLECYKLAVEYYSSTLECMEESDFTMSQKAPIYFSIAMTYKDMGDNNSALKYLKMELDCNKSEPTEQVKTLWKIAEILEDMQNFQEIEKVHLEAVSLSQKIRDEMLEYRSLSKLLYFYEQNMIEKADRIKTKLNNPKFQDISCDESEEEDESEDPFENICLSEMSDFNDTENEANTFVRSKRRPRKPATKVNEKGETPLHQACINGNFTVVKRLVESGHSVNARDFCGWMPLHEASNHGHYDIVEYLLDQDADINDRGGSKCGGITALHDAISNGHFNVMQLLISRGASVTVLDDNGETPFQTLINWKKENQTGLDVDSLRLCNMVEVELKTKMAQAGQPARDSDMNEDTPMYSSDPNFFEDFPILCHIQKRVTEKRARSSSLSSSEQDSDSVGSIESFTNHSIEQRTDWDDAKQAQSEYQSVMSDIRRSAKCVLPDPDPLPKRLNQKSGLVNEQEVVNDWLINDTKYVEKTRKKRRKISRLNVRTSRSLYNYLTPDAPSGLSTENVNPLIIDDASNDSIEFGNASNQFQHSKESVIKKTPINNPSKFSRNDISKLSYCVRVRIADKLILIPVPDDSCTIGWLVEEAAKRYQDLNGSRPKLSLVRDGATLISSDLVKSLYSDNQEVLSSVESWEELPPKERYTQLCNKRGLTPLPSIIEKLLTVDTSFELDISNCSIPEQQIDILFESLSRCKTLKHLDANGTLIMDTGARSMISCFPSFISLAYLELSCCGLTSETLRLIAKYIRNESGQKLPKLTTLILDHNVFSAQCSSFVNTILQLPSLTTFSLISCNLMPSFFENRSLCQTLGTCSKLQEFNIGANNLNDSSICNFLCALPKTNLKKLDLSHSIRQNCNLGKYLRDFLFGGLPLLTKLSLQDCKLTDADLSLITPGCFCCPGLKSLDISINPGLSHGSVIRVLNVAFCDEAPLEEIFLSTTCKWDNDNIDELINQIKESINKSLRSVVLDRITEPTRDKLIHSWKHFFGSKAFYVASTFCKLGVL